MCVFFFFEQEAAYEIMPSFGGSGVCIRDRVGGDYPPKIYMFLGGNDPPPPEKKGGKKNKKLFFDFFWLRFH